VRPARNARTSGQSDEAWETRKNHPTTLGSSEYDEQVAVMEWAERSSDCYPGLDLLHAIPNGGSRRVTVIHGRNVPLEAIRLKRAGLKPGVPDLHLPVEGGRYIGLWIEMKFGYNKPDPNQRVWLASLVKHGHKVVVCYSALDAIDVLTEYIEGAIA